MAAKIHRIAKTVRQDPAKTVVGSMPGQPVDGIIDHKEWCKSEVGIVFPVVIGPIPVIRDVVQIPLALIVEIAELLQGRIDVQVELNLPLFKSVQLLHVSVHHHLRGANLSRVG